MQSALDRSVLVLARLLLSDGSSWIFGGCEIVFVMVFGALLCASVFLIVTV